MLFNVQQMATRRRHVAWRSVMVWLVALTLSACGGGGGGSGGGSSPEAIDTLSDRSGGVVVVTDPASPILGAQVRLLPDSLDGTSEIIRIDYQDALPGELPERALEMEAIPVSKTLILSRSGVNDFNLPAEVTLPYDTELVGADAIPLVFYWNPSTGQYSPVALSQIDRTAGTLTFRTAHFSTFVAMLLQEWDLRSIPPVETGFQSGTDGFFVRNFGAYDQPGGSCLGMANYAGWYFENKKSVKGVGLHALYKDGDPALEEDDQNVRELISRAYVASSQYWANRNFAFQLNAGAKFTGYYLLQNLWVTRNPQVLLMTNENGSNGHAVTVFGYDAEHEHFLIYDNNRPRETHYLPWSPDDGFGTYDALPGASRFGFDALHSSFSPATMEALFRGIESGWSDSRFATITITEPASSENDSHLLLAESEVNIPVYGTIPRLPGEDNPNAQRYAHLYLNGSDKIGVAEVASTGEFEFSIDSLPDPEGTDLIILVSEDAQRWRRGLRGFYQGTLRVRTDEDYLLTVNFAGDGTGRVTSLPAGIDCSSQCSALFADSTTVTLTASPDDGQAFEGWSGACSGSALTCATTLTQARTVTASFTSAGTAGWTLPEAVSAGGAGSARIALRDNGEALLIWRQLDGNGSAEQSVWASRFVPDTGWSAPELLEDNLHSAIDLHLKMDSTTGKAIAGWQQLPDELPSNEGYNVWARTFDPNQGWGALTMIDRTGTGTAGKLTVGVDAGGNAVAVWSQIEAPFTGRWSIYANRFTADGGWGTAELIETETELGRMDGDPSLFVAPNGSALAVWTGSGGSTAKRGIWSNRLMNGAWTTATQIVSPVEIGAFALGLPALVGDATGNALLGFGRLDVSGGQILNKPQVKTYPGGWSSGTTQIVPDFLNGSTVANLFMSSNSSGRQLALWGDTNGTRLRAVFGTQGASWSNPASLSNSTWGINSTPSAGIDDQGHALVTWAQGNSNSDPQTSGEIWVAQYDASSGWAAPQIMDMSEEIPGDPVIAVNARGNAILAWTQYVANVGTRIWVRHYTSGR